MGTEVESNAERAAEQDDDPRVGTVLQNRYRILERLAEGGMGVVYRGERLTLERTVAIKFLHAGFAANADSIKRFERELKAMSRLNHPNCVSVIDYGFDDAPYYVMDYITGRTLKDELGEGRVNPGRAIYITTQILAALTHAHGQGMVHRDIKPANIILTNAEGANDHVYVLDFGLAKFVRSARGDDLTASWMVLGTPSYMSPEQARGANVDVASDVYSTGALLFELLTGDKLYSSDNPIDTLQKHQSAPIPSLRERVPEADFSDALEQVMCKALAKEPAERFGTAIEFAEALDAVPEAVYTPRASSQMRAQTGGIFALAGERAGSVDMLSLADAMDVRDASDAPAGPRATSPGAPSGGAEAQGPTMPLQKQGEGPEQSDDGAGQRDGAAPNGDDGADSGAGPAAAPTRALRKDTDSSGEQDVALASTVPARGKRGKAAAFASTEPAREAVGQTTAPADTTSPARAPEGRKDRDTAARAAAPPPRSSVARVLLALLLPVGVATATWYLLYRPGQSDAGAEQAIAAVGSAASEDAPAAADEGDAPDEGEPEANKPPPPAPVETIRDVEKLIAQGKREQAIQGILKLRRTDFPNSAYLPYLLGNLYFEKVYWSDGLDAYREAIKLNRSYRTKSKINENAIRALQHDEARIKANRLFLRQIRRSGLPYLRKAAKTDKNPKIRRRAAWLIRKITRR